MSRGTKINLKKIDIIFFYVNYLRNCTFFNVHVYIPLPVYSFSSVSVLLFFCYFLM